jgi:hypothetical protein
VTDHSTIDMIIAVDRSASMIDDLSQLTDVLVDFIEVLQRQGTDFQLAITQHDSGCIQGEQPWIDPSFSEREVREALEAMIDIAGPDSSYAEAAFTLFERTLELTDEGECNAGLLRDEAELHLLGISDEAEQSEQSWGHYVTLFQGYEDDPDDLIVHAIGGDYPSGCGSADPYTGMYEATMATGGLFLSICSDIDTWFAPLEYLVGDPGSSFQLSEQAVSSTIEVRVDGVTTTAWVYDSSDNAIVFDAGSEPADGQTVEVEYLVLGDC